MRLQLKDVCRFATLAGYTIGRRGAFSVALMVASLALAQPALAAECPGVSTGSSVTVLPNRIRFAVTPPLISVEDLTSARLATSTMSGRVVRASSGACVVESTVGVDSVLSFDVVQISTASSSSCSAKCDSALQQMEMPRNLEVPEFERARNAAIASFERVERKNVAPNIGVRHATPVAYQAIYAEGSIERRFFSLGREDFAGLTYSSFVDWARARSLRKLDPLSASDQIEASRRRSATTGGELRMEQMEIDAHGWGHRSILMIEGGFQASGRIGIKNELLRSICPPTAQDEPVREGWRELRSRLTCIRETVGLDNWLVVFSKSEPAIEMDDANRYAEMILKELQMEPPPDRARRLIVVTFLPQASDMSDRK